MDTKRIIRQLSEQWDQEPEWFFDLLKGDNGKPVPNLHNAVVILRGEPEFQGLFAHDQMMHSAIVLRGLDDEPSGFEPRPLTDADVSRIQARI